MLAVRPKRGDVAPKESALNRACKAWQCQAALVRGGLRRMGVHGELRTLDLVAAGRRGKSAPRGLAMFAHELYAAGATREEVIERLTDAARMIALAMDEPPGAA